MQHFQIDEGDTQNQFLRDGSLAAHILVGSHPRSRIITAFAAGNSGAGLWCHGNAPLRIENSLRAADGNSGQSVAFSVRADAEELEIDALALGNLRMIRLVDANKPTSDKFAAELSVQGNRLVASRKSLDGVHHYRLEVEVNGGHIERNADKIVFRGASPLNLNFTASTDEDALNPLTEEELLAEGAGPDQRSRDVFSFLAYREKLCAGSWRFLTYFGRDTLLTARLLMPVLSADAIEAALASLLERLSPEGRVAHEEALGEWALCPVVHSYAFDDDRGKGRFAAFAARSSKSGTSYGELLLRNLDYVERAARPFAEEPVVSNLIRIAPGGRVGNWRDSQTGLAGGVYPWDVNVVLVPSALRAAARQYFRVHLDHAGAAAAICKYAADHGIRDPRLAGGLSFDALSLREDGSQVAVMHSDVGYQLIFGTPTAEVLGDTLRYVDRPFPEGLMTPVGMPVANPCQARAEEAAGLGAGDYHGAVMWPWQHAMWILGLREQAERAELPETLRDRMRDLASRIESSTRSIVELRTAELWSWQSEPDGDMSAIPFGQDSEHHAESNAAQLWSAVELILGV
jgi:hypothetical protein